MWQGFLHYYNFVFCRCKFEWMKFIEVLKVFGYILVLILCFALMQALSIFEFNLREDKSITYEQSWAEDFSKPLDDKRWTLKGSEISLHKKQLILELTDLDSTQRAIAMFPSITDSGYVAIKVKFPTDTSLIESEFELVQKSGAGVSLEAFDSNDVYKELRSSILAGGDLKSISMSIASVSKDSLISPYEPEQLIIESIRFMKQVRPQKLF